MSTKIQEISPAAQLGIAAAVLYTCPASTRAQVRRFTAINTTGVTQTVTVHRVPTSGAPTAVNMVVPARAVAGGESLDLFEVCQGMAPGSTIQALASLAASITIQGTVLEIV